MSHSHWTLCTSHQTFVPFNPRAPERTLNQPKFFLHLKIYSYEKVIFLFVVVFSITLNAISSSNSGIAATSANDAISLIETEVLLEPIVSESTAIARFSPEVVAANVEAVPIWVVWALRFVIAMIDCCLEGNCCDPVSGGIIPPNNGTLGGKLSIDMNSYSANDLKNAGVTYDKASGKLVFSRDLLIDQPTFNEKLYVQAGTYFVKEGQKVSATIKVK